MGGVRARLIRDNRALALWIFTCALLLRILIPAGWMPDTGIDGRVRITLCTSTGLVEAYVDRDGTLLDKSSKSEPRTDQPCSFAALGIAVDPPMPAAIAIPLLVPTHFGVMRPSAVAVGRGLAAPPPPAIGPPNLL